MILSVKDFDQIKQRNFTLDCPSMELVPVVDGNRERYKGSGYISFRESGLEFKFFSNQAYQPRIIFLESPAKAGQLFEDFDYYVVQASDISGNSWRSSRFLPDFTFGRGIIAEGKMAEIAAFEDWDLPIPKPSTKLWFLGDLELPLNVSAHSETSVGGKTISQSWASDSAIFECSGYEIFARTDDGWTTVEVSKEGDTLPETLSRRIEESVEFMIAHPVRASIVEAQSSAGMSARVISHSPQSITGNAKSPIVRSSEAYRNHGWQLFDRFFRYVESHEGPQRPPLSRILQYIVQMNSSPIDAQALALGVAVEGLLKETYSNVVSPAEEFLGGLESAATLIQGSTLAESTIARILGSIGQMREIRAKDRLLALVAKQVITKAQYDAWVKLRNSSAHAHVHHLDNNFLSLCNRVRVLAYCLIFNAISYAGPFTDYGTPDWPERYYPFHKEVEAGE